MTTTLIVATAVLLTAITILLASSVTWKQRCRQFKERPLGDQLLVTGLSGFQKSTWLEDIMRSGRWRNYEDKKYFLPESMTWSYTPAEGVVVLRNYGKKR